MSERENPDSEYWKGYNDALDEWELRTNLTGLSEKVEEFLRSLRYESSRGIGERGLLPHHVAQFTPQFVAFVEQLLGAKGEGALSR